MKALGAEKSAETMEPDSQKLNGGASSYLETVERWFRKYVEDRMAETGETEQQVLDTIKSPGFTGRKAQKTMELEAEMSSGVGGPKSSPALPP